jgi:hypothetical protein
MENQPAPSNGPACSVSPLLFKFFSAAADAWLDVPVQSPQSPVVGWVVGSLLGLVVGGVIIYCTRRGAARRTSDAAKTYNQMGN